jgi:hypothetical protein
MKSAVTWVVGLAIALGGGWFAIRGYNHQEARFLYQRELSGLQREFLADSLPLFRLDTQGYQRDIGPHLSKYFRGIDKLARDRPGLYDLEREIKATSEKVAAGLMTEPQARARSERIALTTDVYNRMRQGQYRPIYTASDNNFRFDIYDISPARVAGEHKIKFSYVHWGPFPREHRPGSGTVSYDSIVGNIKALQAEGKPAELPQLVGDAQPPSLQVSPERWIAEFPAGAELGFYDLPLFPKNATTLQLTFAFGIRTVGGSKVMANIAFEEIPIPDGWKLAEGQKWESQQRFASDDELEAAGVEPTQN